MLQQREKLPLLWRKAVPESTKKATLYALNVFVGKLTVTGLKYSNMLIPVDLNTLFAQGQKFIIFYRLVVK